MRTRRFGTTTTLAHRLKKVRTNAGAIDGEFGRLTKLANSNLYLPH